jgi:putative ABC transport system ATP-binding protein
MMLLQTIGLTKRYERRGVPFFAADHIDLRVDAGDFVCITGESGSGKSTLMNMLTGLLKADGGTIFFDGEDLSLLSDDALTRLRSSKIGYVPQGNSLLQNLSVLDNICLPWYLSHRGDIKDAALKLLAQVGIRHLAAESPRNLSGGETRRAAIARSLITGPKLLIADEPTGDIDPKNTDEILGLFGEVNGQGTTVVMVTHERQMPAFANRHFVMDDGRLTE